MFPVLRCNICLPSLNDLVCMFPQLKGGRNVWKLLLDETSYADDQRNLFSLYFLSRNDRWDFLLLFAYWWMFGNRCNEVIKALGMLRNGVNESRVLWNLKTTVRVLAVRLWSSFISVISLVESWSIGKREGIRKQAKNVTYSFYTAR